MMRFPVDNSGNRPTTVLLVLLIVVVAVNFVPQVRVAASPDDCLALGGALAAGECQISSAQTKSGTFALDETLRILGTGSITVPAISGGNALTLNIKGDLIIDVGGQLIGDVSTAGGIGATISINADGDIILHGVGASGARISSSQSAGSCTGGRGGNINLDAGGEIVVEPGSVIAANSNRCRAGDIVMTADGIISIDGLVSSGPNTTVNPLPGRLTGQVLGGGGTTQAGGKITIVCDSLSSPSLTVSKEGILVSQGEDPGADTILIEGCDVEINGLVASVGKQNKAQVILRSGDHITINGQDLGQTDINSYPNQGRVRADNTQTGADQSKVDIFARGSIDIHGPPSGTIFVVTSNPGSANSRPPGGFITVISLEDRITATGKAFQAGRSTAGNSGGTVDLKAKLDVDLDGAIMAVGDFIATGGYGTGGEINVRSFSAAVTWTNGIGDVQPTGTGIAAAQRGVITLTACTIVDTTGTSFPVTSGSPTTPTISTGVCSPSAPTLPEGVADLPYCSIITIIKDTVPDDAQDFSFTTTGVLSPPSFTLDDDPSDLTWPNNQTYTRVASGSYTVTETLPVAGFELTGLVCIDPDGGTTVDLGTGTATIDVDASETITCTYTNRKSGTIIVEKQTIPDGDAELFAFAGDAIGSISDGQQIIEGGLVAGSYYSTETVPDGWKLTDITCNDTNSSGDLGTKTATFNLDAGETVKCTFTDEKLGTIVVEKQTIPPNDPASFEFTGTANGTISDNGQITVTNLPPENYTSTETVPPGWDLTSIVCNDTDSSGNVGTGVATFDLDAGETVKCTFTDEKLGTIIVEKVSVGGAATFNFTSPDIPDGSPWFNITTASGSTNQTIFSNLAAGTYHVTESGPDPPWNFAGLSCTSGGSVIGQAATIDLPAGGSVKCTFTDEKPTGQLLGTIIIEKKTVGGDGTFTYTSTSSSTTPLSSPFSITTIGSLGNQTFINLQPGTYNVTESGPSPPWEFTDLKCTAGGSVSDQNATITLAAGETVTCTFTNELPTGPSCPFVNSKTIFGDELIPITLKADSKCPATPFCLTAQGTHKFKAPSSVWVNRVSYRFVRWEDDSHPPNVLSTSTSLTYNLQSGNTVYAVYEPAKYTLTVYVKDVNTRKPIVQATVELHYMTQTLTGTTDKRGKVTFTIYGGKPLTLTITKAGYQDLTTTPMTLTKDTKQYTAYLTPSP